MMSDDKRFQIVYLNGLDKLCSIQDTSQSIPTFYNDLGLLQCIGPVCDLLNELDEEITELKTKNNRYLQDLKVLKSQVDDKTVAVEVAVCEQMENILKVIDKQLMAAEKGFEMTSDSWYQGQIDALKELSNNLRS